MGIQLKIMICESCKVTFEGIDYLCQSCIDKDPSYPYNDSIGVIGLYTCSCHLFPTYEDAKKAQLQKFVLGEKVKHRCSGDLGVVKEVCKEKGYIIVSYGSLPKDNHLNHVQQLIKQ